MEGECYSTCDICGNRATNGRWSPGKPAQHWCDDHIPVGGQKIPLAWPTESPTVDPRTIELATVVHPSGAVLRLWAARAVEFSEFTTIIDNLDDRAKRGLPMFFDPAIRVEVISPAAPVAPGFVEEHRVDDCMVRFEAPTLEGLTDLKIRCHQVRQEERDTLASMRQRELDRKQPAKTLNQSAAPLLSKPFKGIADLRIGDAANDAIGMAGVEPERVGLDLDVLAARPPKDPSKKPRGGWF